MLKKALKNFGKALKKEEKSQSRFPHLSELINGSMLKHYDKEVFHCMEMYKLPYTSGSFSLNCPESAHTLGMWNKIPLPKAMNKGNIAFIDTETTGLGIGTGTFAFLTGIGYFDGDNFYIHQYFLPEPGAEDVYLSKISTLIKDFEYIISFNGKTYDIPLLASRFIFNKLEHDFTSLPHLDMLHISRRFWSKTLKDCSLGSLERNILGVERAGEDVDGYLIPQMYFDYLRSKDAKDMPGIFYHNKVDILSLAGIFSYIASFLDEPKPKNAVFPTDLLAAGKIMQILGEKEQALKIFMDFKSQENINKAQEITAESISGLIHKRDGSFDKAIECWLSNSQNGDIESMIELAKYYEHREKDWHTAMSWTEKALNQINKDDIGKIEELLHRKNRLRMKIDKNEQKD